jgi:multidrug efflux pump subunit AcrB
MTSLAFILGVLPLVFATAPARRRGTRSARTRRRMLVSTLLNILLHPVLYVIVQSARGRLAGIARHRNANPLNTVVF